MNYDYLINVTTAFQWIIGTILLFTVICLPFIAFSGYVTKRILIRTCIYMGLALIGLVYLSFEKPKMKQEKIEQEIYQNQLKEFAKGKVIVNKERKPFLILFNIYIVSLQSADGKKHRRAISFDFYSKYNIGDTVR